MDNFDNTESGESESPDEAKSDLPVEPNIEVLEGEVVQAGHSTDIPNRQVEVLASESGETPDNSREEATGRESVERGLAQYVFVREDREREVRLTFRDASANDIAYTFRTAGAHLITLFAERATRHGSAVKAQPPEDNLPVDEGAETGDEFEAEDITSRRRTTRHRSREMTAPAGEVLLRYFYALGETVYTVNIVSPTGVATSIAGTYPLAARSERDLRDRLAVVFI